MLGKYATVRPLPQPLSAFEDWGCLPGCQQPGFLQESKAVSLPTRHQHAPHIYAPHILSFLGLISVSTPRVSQLDRGVLSVCLPSPSHCPYTPWEKNVPTPTPML